MTKLNTHHWDLHCAKSLQHIPQIVLTKASQKFILFYRGIEHRARTVMVNLFVILSLKTFVHHAFLSAWNVWLCVNEMERFVLANAHPHNMADFYMSHRNKHHFHSKDSLVFLQIHMWFISIRGKVCPWEKVGWFPNIGWSVGCEMVLVHEGGSRSQGE